MSENETLYAFTGFQLIELFQSTIDLYEEYQQVHGYNPEEAKNQVSFEDMPQGIDAEREMFIRGECSILGQVYPIPSDLVHERSAVSAMDQATHFLDAMSKEVGGPLVGISQKAAYAQALASTQSARELQAIRALLQKIANGEAAIFEAMGMGKAKPAPPERPDPL